MRSLLMAPLCVAALLGLLACRELTMPQDSVPDGSVAQTEILVLDREGEALPDVTVTLENRRYVETPHTRIDDTTDDTGRIHVLAPVGYYQISLRPRSSSGHADWQRNAVLLDGRPVVIDYDLVLFSGVVEVEGREGDELHGDIVLRTKFEFPRGTDSPRTYVRVTPDGSFATEVGPYVYSIAAGLGSDDWDLNYDWPDSIALTQPIQRDLSVPSLPLTLQLGLPDPSALQPNLEVRVENEDFRFTARNVDDISQPVMLRAPSGIGMLRVFSFSRPFLEHELRVDFNTTSTIALSLGEYRVDFQVTSSSGSSVANKVICVISQDSGTSKCFETDIDGESFLYLHPGRYRVTAGTWSEGEIQRLIDVDSDMTVILDLDSP